MDACNDLTYCCKICYQLVCDLFVADKCCKQIFCKKCLQDYLKEIEDDPTMPCPCCKVKGFTYAPFDETKKEKDIDGCDDHSSCTDILSIQGNHQHHLPANHIATNTATTATAEDDIRGHDCDFVETPADDLICKICHFPARDPQQTNLCCGHTFCATCLEKYANSKILDNKHCPICNKEPFTYMPDARTKRFVGDLKVFCPHKSLGCTWTGELRSLEQHLVKDIANKKGCSFTELQCSNGCGVVMQRRLVEGHLKSECELREVKCEYCNTTGSYQWITNIHEEECPNYPVECPNHCEVGHVTREKFSKHLKECPLAVVRCLFGCEGVLLRRYIAEHMKEAVTLHIEHTMKCVEQLQGSSERLENKIHEVQTELHNTNDTTKNELKTVTENIEATVGQVEVTKCHLSSHDSVLDELIKNIRALEQRASDAENIARHVQQNLNAEMIRREAVEVKLRTDLDRVSTELDCTKEMNSNAVTAIKQRYDTIMDEKRAEMDRLNNDLREQAKELQSCKEAYEKQLQAADEKFNTQLQKKEEEMRQQFTHEIQAYRDNFKVFLDLQDWSMQLQYLCKTRNSVLPNVYLKISEVVIRSAVTRSSKSFYTSDKGYKMSISVSSSNTYVSVRVFLMRGEYDNHLRWPVKGTLKIQLLNQIYDGNHTDSVDIEFDGAEDNSCCQRVLGGNQSNYGNYHNTFISNKGLAEDTRRRHHYHKNGTLYFKILEFVDRHER